MSVQFNKDFSKAQMCLVFLISYLPFGFNFYSSVAALFLQISVLSLIKFEKQSF